MSTLQQENEKYEVLEVIGRGAFGIIRKVRSRKDGKIMCRKEINYLKMSPKERDQLSAELNILSSFDNSNIVRYFHRDHIKQTQELFMYMEFCGGGDLGTYIKELKQQKVLVREEFVWRILSQVVSALYRCHYGVNAPEPNNPAGPVSKLAGNRTNPTVLHRDLKPENIFLDEDKSVKLGDFGLSKLMSPSDYASTYVGTPFYMSPEICTGERYTLKSDIWALGCIMYELCTGEPPFNATTHLQLISKIRKESPAPLPRQFSHELSSTIRHCLEKNPTSRPSTEDLLMHPMVFMARKEQHFIQLTKTITSEKESLLHKLRAAEEQIRLLESSKSNIKVDLESQIRREWEVKARLEIDRQVDAEYQAKLKSLQLSFDQEVSKRVKQEMAKYNYIAPTTAPNTKDSKRSYHSSVATTAESDWAEVTALTELSDLSIDSPASSALEHQLPLKKAKTPFSRAKTTFDSPSDIAMADPSPMSITSLNLSPRRQAGINVLAGKNLFTKIASNKARKAADTFEDSDDKENQLQKFFDSEDEEEDDIPELPSPTRAKQCDTDPFKMQMPPPPYPASSRARPGIQRTNTIATTTRISTKPNIFSSASQTTTFIPPPSQIPRSSTDTDLKSHTLQLGPPTSPVSITKSPRRLSKIPSHNNLAADNAAHANLHGITVSPLRRHATINGPNPNLTATMLKSKKGALAREGLSETTPNAQINPIAGRNRIDLARERAGGRPSTTDGTSQGQDQIRSRSPEKELPEIPRWDPLEIGEEAMPSPFLKRDVKNIVGLPMGIGSGMGMGARIGQMR